MYAQLGFREVAEWEVWVHSEHVSGVAAFNRSGVLDDPQSYPTVISACSRRSSSLQRMFEVFGWPASHWPQGSSALVLS